MKKISNQILEGLIIMCPDVIPQLAAKLKISQRTLKRLIRENSDRLMGAIRMEIISCEAGKTRKTIIEERTIEEDGQQKCVLNIQVFVNLDQKVV